MNKTVSILTITTILLFAGIVSAHQQVVVVPIGKTTNAVTTSGDSWIRVYDNNDVFIGYAVDNDLVISPNKYIAYLEYYLKDGGYVFVGNSPFYYNSTNCSGNLFAVKQYNLYGVFGNGGPGRLMSDYYGPVLTHYYIPIGANPVVRTNGSARSYYGGSPTPTCQTSTTWPADTEVYELVPNDPNVTGFQNSYAFPLKLDYTLPSSP